MFDYQNALYHVGIRVRDLEAAMAELGAGLGITWATVQERQQRLWTPAGGSITTPLRFTYSCEGPQHVELLEGQPGTVWYADESPGMHHQGIWVDDVAAETERFIALGWTLEAAQLSPEEGYGSMTYVRSPQGILIEPVTSRAKDRFAVWFAGGELG